MTAQERQAVKTLIDEAVRIRVTDDRTHRCVQCGHKFQSPYRTQSYCSDPCRTAYRKHKREYERGWREAKRVTA